MYWDDSASPSVLKVWDDCTNSYQNANKGVSSSGGSTAQIQYFLPGTQPSNMVLANGAPTGACTIAAANFGANLPDLDIAPSFTYATFSSPVNSDTRQMAKDSLGNIYLANTDTTLPIIQKVTPSGVVSAFVNNDAFLVSSTGIWADALDDFYIIGPGAASTSQIPIRKYNASGVLQASPYANLPANSNNYQGIVMDSLGNIFSTSGATGTVRKSQPNGSASTVFASMPNANGIAIDSADNLYVSSNTNIIKVTPAGIISTFAIGVPASLGISFDIAGNLIVNTAGDVLSISPVGVVTNYLIGAAGSNRAVIQGSDGRIYYKDGTLLRVATLVQVAQPYVVCS
jgi:hypothetical protein